jgi:MYXO-CTERM domain-containing protein
MKGGTNLNTTIKTIRSCLLVWVAAAAAQPALGQQLATTQNHGISPALAHNEQGHAVPTGLSRLFGPVQPPPRTLFDGGNTPPAADLWFAETDPVGLPVTPLAAMTAHLHTTPVLRAVPVIELRSSAAAPQMLPVPMWTEPGATTVPAPGAAALFMVAASLAVRRRRR